MTLLAPGPRIYAPTTYSDRDGRGLPRLDMADRCVIAQAVRVSLRQSVARRREIQLDGDGRRSRGGSCDGRIRPNLPV